MKIAFIGQKGIPVSQGGVERHVEELARNLALRGHRVLVYARSTYPRGKAILPQRVHIIELPSVPVKVWDTVIHTLLSSIDVLFRRVDVIHYHSIGPAFLMFIPYIFKSNAKLVFTHHTYEMKRPQWGWLSRFILGWGERIGMRLADEVIAINPAVAMDLEARYGRRVSTVPSGVTKFAENFSSPIDLPGRYIVAVSRLIRSKGLDHLINAFNLISDDYPDYHLLIVGSPTKNDNDHPRLLKLKGDNPRIHFLGWQPSDRLNYIYRNASVFVQPSEIEGLPITLLEAALSGLPIVSSDILEHKVILRSSGVFFRNSSFIELAAKLRIVLNDLPAHRNVAKSLSERIKREFDWDEITSRIIKIYRYPPYPHVFSKRQSV